MSEHLLENHTRVEANLLILVPAERREQDLWLAIEVLDGGESRADLSSQQAIEDLDNVLP